MDRKERAEKEEILTPSQILNNQGRYRQQKLIIEGRVSPEAAVCRQIECLPGNPCCGCPNEKDLVIINTGVVLTPETESRLRLRDLKGNSFCRRLTSSRIIPIQDRYKYNDPGKKRLDKMIPL